jgi:hypothetical protein
VNEDREGSTGGEEGSAATQILYNPMSNQRGWPVGDKGYFPLTMTFRRDGCDRVWDAACVFKIFRLGVYLPLIPVITGGLTNFSFGDGFKLLDHDQRNTWHIGGEVHAALAELCID